MKKKIVGIILALCMAMCLMNVSIMTASAMTSGACGENVTWALNDGVLTISGTGAMKDYKGIIWETGEEDWPEWRELEVTQIIVEDGVTSIGSYAFHGLKNAKSISLPNSLVEIKNHAFAFSGIETLVIPDSVEKIGFFAISDSVVTLEIGSGVKTLDGAIQYNFGAALNEIKVSENNPYFSAENNILFNKDKTELIRYAANKEGDVYIVPGSVKVIKSNAFERCENLKKVIISEGVEKLEANVFYGCWDMENIRVPNSITEIDATNLEAFQYGTNFKMDYMGTVQDFGEVKILEGKVNGQKEDGSYIYEYVQSSLPEEDCVEIVYNPIIKVVLGDRKIAFDVYPQIVNGRTMVPMRAIFEALGATVEWNNETRSVTSVKGEIEIKLAIDSTELYVNDSVKTLDVPACIVDNRTMVPVRAISEAFGCNVEWNNDTRTVYIYE